MKLIETTAELRKWRRMSAARVVFVPTMGALHEGHAELIREAKRLAGKDGRVAASIFVNPLQFGPKEDFSRYPRTLEADCKICEAAGADMVFAPSVKEVYSDDRSVKIIESSLSNVLCGASRPGHFDGVCTVVAKLFNLVQPDDAVFGKKDYQQLAIIRRMARDLDFPVAIHGMETVREPDGLAKSSRNRYLGGDERKQAAALRSGLLLARAAFADGERNPRRLEEIVRREMAEKAPLGRADYVSCVDAESLNIIDEGASKLLATPCWLIAVAAFFGKARLIDNIELHRG